MPKLHNHLTGWKLLCLLAVIVYLPFLNNPFIFDDAQFQHAQFQQHFLQLSAIGDLRWVGYASLGMTAKIFSDAVPWFFHAGNLLVHIAVAILLYQFLLRLMTFRFQNPADMAVIRQSALLSAAIFTVNPVAVYATGYVIQRSILLATMFGLLMLLAYMRAMQTGQIRWLLVSVLGYYLACFSKEHGILLPLLLIPLHSLICNKQPQKKWALSVAWISYGFIAAMLLLRVKGIWGAAYEPFSSALIMQEHIRADEITLHLLSVLTQAGMYFKYLGLWLVPSPTWMSIDMRENFVTSISSWQGWLALFGFTLYGAVSIWLLQNKGKIALLGYGMLFPWLLFLPEFSSIRIQEIFVLYRSYLWLPGFMLVYALACMHWHWLRGRNLNITIITLLVLLSWNRLYVMSDELRLWNDAVDKLPVGEQVAGTARIYFNRAQALYKRRDLQAALADYEKVIKLHPELVPVQYQTAVTNIQLQNYQAAGKIFRHLMEVEPENAFYPYYFAICQKHQQNINEARLYMDKSCKMGNSLACQWKY